MHYGMYIKVEGIRHDRLDVIKKAAEKEWPWDKWYYSLNGAVVEAHSYGESHLYSGESEEDFSTRLATTVWLANKGFCKIEIEAVYLDARKIHTLNKEDYDKLISMDETKIMSRS